MSIETFLIDPPKCATDHIWNDAMKDAYRCGLNDVAADIRAAFPHPTLGIQKVLKMIDERLAREL